MTHKQKVLALLRDGRGRKQLRCGACQRFVALACFEKHVNEDCPVKWDGSPDYVRFIYSKPDGRKIACLGNGTRTSYARLVAAKKIGRSLRREEIVHHVNGDKADDRPENLEVVASQADHARLHSVDTHAAQWGGDRRCRGCGKDVRERTRGCLSCSNRHLGWRNRGDSRFIPAECRRIDAA